jgi:tetratricopeptide (TPR) repeat protein
MSQRMRLRPQWHRGQTLIAVVSVVVASVGAGVAVWPHAWPWLLVGGTVAAVVLPKVSLAAGARRSLAREARAALQETTGGIGDQLPTVGVADLGSRIHRAAEDLPYVRRDAEEQIREFLRSGEPVLLIGPSMVGKTRTAVTIVESVFAGWPVVIPDAKDSLARLNMADIQIRNSIVWLDDIHRLIGADGITDGQLKRYAANGNRIVATILAGEYDRYTPDDKARLPEWDVLCFFKWVNIGRELSPDEDRRLREVVHDQELLDRIRETGIGEYVGAAPLVGQKLRNGPSANPVGYAIVRGATDWRRAGIGRPVPGLLLPALAAPHLRGRDLPALSRENDYATALGWATKAIGNNEVSLLRPLDSTTYEVYDYAFDLISSEASPIPDAVWDICIDSATPPEQFDVGYSARMTFERFDIAKRAWRSAIESGHPSAAPRSALHLGLLLSKEGGNQGADVNEARAAFELAIDSGRTDAAPTAALNLGILLWGQEDMASARSAYQLAIDSGHHFAAPAAWAHLGILLQGQGDNDGAQAAFQRAIETGTRDFTIPMAQVLLGRLLIERGDEDGALEAFQHAIDSEPEDEEIALMAAGQVADLRMKKGDAEGARVQLERLIDSGHPDYAPGATTNLGALLARQGDMEGARVAFQAAIDSRDVAVAPKAAENLGVLLGQQEKFDEARIYLQLAIDLAGASAMPRAALLLGNALAILDDRTGAEEAFRAAIDSGDTEYGPHAALRLGDLLALHGVTEGARDAYQEASDSGHSEVAPEAMDKLGPLLAALGDSEGARAALQAAIDSRHPEYAPRSALNLGIMLAQQGDEKGAHAAFQAAIDTGHPDYADAAGFLKGMPFFIEPAPEGTKVHLIGLHIWKPGE